MGARPPAAATFNFSRLLTARTDLWSGLIPSPETTARSHPLFDMATASSGWIKSFMVDRPTLAGP